MRVLLIEEESRTVETLRRGLGAYGIDVDAEPDGVAGLRTAAADRHDVIVLDLLLPGLSGYRVLEELRERRIWTPVLVLTAKDGEYDEADALDLGADDYLTTPFSMVVLVARLRALLRRGRPERPVVMSAGELTVDPALRRVTSRRREVALSPREYDVLELLMRRKGQAVAKAEILARVWGRRYAGGVNVVEVYIRHLRRKLGTTMIHTIRGTGYALTG